MINYEIIDRLEKEEGGRPAEHFAFLFSEELMSIPEIKQCGYPAVKKIAKEVYNTLPLRYAERGGTIEEWQHDCDEELVGYMDKFYFAEFYEQTGIADMWVQEIIASSGYDYKKAKKLYKKRLKKAKNK